ncbi:hypothetical protein [Bradyrhizobium cosmicum]|uniref:hypothetical protein n=1 Tax=Bradyrhizobium cosmicum TaxID=1404864 RepID=UPI001FCE59FB|nr:hypothetical protein [Bradyrhizobium cosmicum]
MNLMQSFLAAFLGRLDGRNRSKYSDRRLEMAEIDPVDWNVEEFRRLLDGPFKPTSEPARVDELSDLAWDDYQLTPATTEDSLAPEETGDGISLPAPAGGESANSVSFIPAQPPVEPSLESVARPALQDTDHDPQPLSATTVSVLKIEIASVFRTAPANLSVDSMQDHNDRPSAMSTRADLDAAVHSTAELFKGGLPGEVEQHEDDDEVGRFFDEFSASSGVSVSPMLEITEGHPQQESAVSGPSLLATLAEGAPTPIERPQLQKNEIASKPALEVEAATLDRQSEASPPAKEVGQPSSLTDTKLYVEEASAIEKDRISEDYLHELDTADPDRPDGGAQTMLDPPIEIPERSQGSNTTWIESASTADLDVSISSAADDAAGFEPLDIQHLIQGGDSSCDRPLIGWDATDEKLTPLPEALDPHACDATALVAFEGNIQEHQRAVVGNQEVPREPMPSPGVTSNGERIDAAEHASADGGPGPVKVPVVSPASPLLKAIVEPDIWTDRVDRDRAIDLRWALRDIRANRLRWLPIDPLTLQTLVDLNFVEIADGKPVLTSAGSEAIAST